MHNKTSRLAYWLDYFFPPRDTDLLVRGLQTHPLALLKGQSGLPLSYQSALARALVWEVKFYHNKHALHIAGNLLAQEMLQIASDYYVPVLLIPIPLHKKRRRERGFNQTEALCEALLKAAPRVAEYRPEAMMRTVYTPPQKKLSKYERLEQIARTMRAEKTIVAGRICVVLDDVTTTGATFAEAKRALLAAGAAEVVFLALAH